MSVSEIVDPNLQLHCVDQPDHLIVTAAGVWTENFFRHIVDTARERAVESGITRILLDMRKVSRPAYAYTRFVSGKYLAETMGTAFRIAAVGTSENVTHYGETVARNRGSELLAFTDGDQAMQWLLR